MSVDIYMDVRHHLKSQAENSKDSNRMRKSKHEAAATGNESSRQQRRHSVRTESSGLVFPI